MKIITICGSLKFEQEIKYHAEKLGLEVILQKTKKIIQKTKLIFWV
jgi:hypothetical protein